VGRFDAQALSEKWMERFSVAMEQTMIKHDEEINALAIAQVRVCVCVCVCERE
jgi:hypothetical protein